MGATRVKLGQDGGVQEDDARVRVVDLMGNLGGLTKEGLSVLLLVF
jgi:hypothetical protein